MNNFAHFIGFFTAHIVWKLESNENIVPCIATQKAGNRWFEAVPNDDSYEEAVATARERLQSILLDNDYALLIYDGFLTWEGERRESLVVEAIEVQASDEMAFLMAIPYRPTSYNNRLTIYSPKVIKIPGASDNNFFDGFYEGASSHTKGIEFWMAHMENSN